MQVVIWEGRGYLVVDMVTGRERQGYSLAFVSALFSGISTVVGKWNLTAIAPLMMNALIFTGATLYMTVGYLPFRGVRKSFMVSKTGWKWIGLFTASSQLAVFFFWAGVQKIDPTLASFLNRSEVLVAIMCGILFLGERLNRWEVIGGLLSIAGIVTMRLTLRFEYSLGFWLVLIGSFFFGITEVFSKIAVRHAEPIAITYYRNAIMAVVYCAVLACTAPDFSGLRVVWPGVLALSLLGPILSRVVYLAALARIELSRAAIIGLTQPIYVVLIAFTVLGQLPSGREVIGGVLLTVGCLIMVLSRGRIVADSLRAVLNTK